MRTAAWLATTIAIASILINPVIGVNDELKEPLLQRQASEGELVANRRRPRQPNAPQTSTTAFDQQNYDAIMGAVAAAQDDEDDDDEKSADFDVTGEGSVDDNFGSPQSHFDTPSESLGSKESKKSVGDETKAASGDQTETMANAAPHIDSARSVSFGSAATKQSKTTQPQNTSQRPRKVRQHMSFAEDAELSATPTEEVTKQNQEQEPLLQAEDTTSSLEEAGEGISLREHRAQQVINDDKNASADNQSGDAMVFGTVTAEEKLTAAPQVPKNLPKKVSSERRAQQVINDDKNASADNQSGDAMAFGTVTAEEELTAAPEVQDQEQNLPKKVSSNSETVATAGSEEIAQQESPKTSLPKNPTTSRGVGETAHQLDATEFPTSSVVGASAVGITGAVTAPEQINTNRAIPATAGEIVQPQQQMPQRRRIDFSVCALNIPKAYKGKIEPIISLLVPNPNAGLPGQQRHLVKRVKLTHVMPFKERIGFRKSDCERFVGYHDKIFAHNAEEMLIDYVLDNKLIASGLFPLEKGGFELERDFTEKVPLLCMDGVDPVQPHKNCGDALVRSFHLCRPSEGPYSLNLADSYYCRTYNEDVTVDEQCE